MLGKKCINFTDFVPFTSQHHGNYWRGCSTVPVQYCTNSGRIRLHACTCCSRITCSFYDSWTSGVRFHV